MNRTKLLAVGSVAVVVILLAALFVGRSGSSEATQEEGLTEVLHPVELSIWSPAGEIASREPERTLASGKAILVVRDLLTGEFLPGVRVDCATESGDSWIALGTTNQDGQMSAEELEFDVRATELVGSLPEEMGGARIALSVMESDDPSTILLSGAAYSILELRAIADLASIEEVRLRAIAVPPIWSIPSGWFLPEEELFCQRMQYSDPDNYRTFIQRRLDLMSDDDDEATALEFALSIEHKLTIGKGGVHRFAIPYEGELFLSAYADTLALVPATTVVTAERGVVHQETLFLELAPFVSGYVRGPDGSPMEGAPVTISCRSTFFANELIPRAADQPANPAFAVETSPEGDTTVFAISRVESDSKGYFKALVPFTDSVSVACMIDGYMKTEERVLNLERNESIRGLELELREAATHRSMRFVTLTGDPVKEFHFAPAEIDPPHPFKLQYPELVTDREGHVSVSFLDPQREYLVFSSDGGYQEIRFICQYGGTVVCEEIE